MNVFTRFHNCAHDAPDNTRNQLKGKTMSLQNIRWQHFVRHGLLALMVGFAMLFSAAIDSMRPAQAAPTPAVGMARTSDNSGYWIVARDGAVYSYGNARYHGGANGIPHAPIVGMARTSTNGGYWLVASDGAIYTFGTARYYGGANTFWHPAPIVDIAATSTNGGYWLVASDGAIYSFGDARYHGGANGIPHAPIVGMARTSTNGGYWLVADDGAIYSFGDARYHGGANGIPHAPIVDIAVLSDNSGYWLVASDGAIYSFGTARYYGGANTASGSDAMQPVSGTVTGVLSNRCGSYDADHYGIDIGTGTATPPISATAGGTVIARNYDSGQGNYVYIRHNNGYVSRYLHLSKFADGLAVGQVKARGDVIGYVGTTGNSTGNHLHFEMRKDGTVVNMSSAYKCGQTVTRGQPIPFSFPGI